MSKETKTRFFGIPDIFPYLNDYRKKTTVMVITGVLFAAFDLMTPLFNRYAINHFIGGKTLKGIVIFGISYALILVCQAVLNFISTKMVADMEVSVSRDLRNASFSHLQTLSFSYYNENNVGYIHARVMSDTGRIGMVFSWILMDYVWDGTYLIGVFIVMFSINWQLGLLLALLIPAASVLIYFVQKKLIKLHREIREQNSKITGDFNEGISGALTIKNLVIERKIADDFENDTEKMRRTSVGATRNQAFLNSSVALFSSLALALVLWRGGLLTMQRLMLIGTLSVFMTYAQNIMDPIQTIVSDYALLIQSQGNMERFTKLMRTESDVRDKKSVIEKYGDTFNPKKENWEPLKGDVEFRNVSFKYKPEDDYVLKNFNLLIPAGTNVAIVGETGAGKSTLVNLVCRFFEPTSGEILIDGKDVRERSQLWLHSNLGYVLQTPHLFSGTVRDNLKYGKPDATDDEIMRAIDIVDARAVIDKMPSGLDSEVGEGGDLLSTGEKQLLSFARAILADPRLLVLDEATSSIDTLTEQKIQKAIQTVIKGRTSFMIAHRLSTVVDCDVILVVRDGRIVEKGTHKELMSERGYYYELFTRQFQESETDRVFGENQEKSAI